MKTAPLETIKEGLSNLKKLYATIFALALVALVEGVLLIVVLSSVGSIKPVVIRVSEVGKAEAVDLSSSSSPASSVEIKYLAKELVETLFGFSRLTWEDDLRRALPYISYSLKNDFLNAYKNLASQYLSSGLEVKVTVFSVVILSERNGLVQVRVDYEKIPSAGQAQKFYAVLVFRRTERTVENPFGLELVSFNESRFLQQ